MSKIPSSSDKPSEGLPKKPEKAQDNRVKFNSTTKNFEKIEKKGNPHKMNAVGKNLDTYIQSHKDYMTASLQRIKANYSGKQLEGDTLGIKHFFSGTSDIETFIDSILDSQDKNRE